MQLFTFIALITFILHSVRKGVNDNPEAFGLHDNANIAFLTQESNKIIDAILIIQPRLADGSQEKSSDEIVTDIAMNLMKDVPVNFNPEHGNKKLFERNEMGLMTSLSTFLLQELEKFNILLNVIRDSLDQLIKAIKGLVVMSQELDEMYTAFLNNQLPNNWKKVSYPSLKPLGSWYQDMLERVIFLDNWLKNDQPASYWMSGFFFPQGFITGVLQTHARKYKIPIDKLAFNMLSTGENSSSMIYAQIFIFYASGSIYRNVGIPKISKEEFFPLQ